MSAENRPAHSPLGASSAERWMNCPGSVALIKGLDLDESDEPEYRGLGIAAHEAAAHCLKNDMDAWEIMGEKFHNFPVDQNMAQAIQTYIDTVRPDIIDAQTTASYIEHGLAYVQTDGALSEIIDPRADGLLKKYFYGTGDCAIVMGKLMKVIDYKHGEGIIVEADNNPQLMYYAFGFMLVHPEVETVLIRIVQPRTFDEPVKTWVTSANYIREWVANQLVPAMQLTEVDGAELDAGPWCRFCPAKLVCPMMSSLFGAAMKYNPKQLVDNTNASIGRSYQYMQAVKFYLKALEDETFRRLNLGQDVPGTKLVPKKANRVYKSEASALAKKQFGKDAMVPAKLKSPSELEELGSEAKEFVREYAYTPQTGLTVAREDDNRPAVKVQTTQEAFAGALAKLGD